MRYRSQLALTVTFLGLSLLWSQGSAGHDLLGLVAETASLDAPTRSKIERINQTLERLATQAQADSGGQLEAIVQSSLRWPAGSVSVCFFDGAQVARDHIADVAARWTPGTSLVLDFGPVGARATCDPGHPSDIRVSFHGVGYSSYVGTIAKQIDAHNQTLTLQGMDRSDFSADDDGVILHEFGHAIGFQHEHQSPKSGCQEEFDFPWLYSYFAQQGWSKEMVDSNMQRLDVSSSMSGFLITPFDAKSEMLYSLDKKAFKNPTSAKCYISHANNDISDTDRAAVQAVYWVVPPAPAAPGKPIPEAAASDLHSLQDLLGTKKN